MREHNTGMISSSVLPFITLKDMIIKPCKCIGMNEHRQIPQELCVCEFLSIMYMLRVFIRNKNRIIKYWVLIEMVKYKLSTNAICLSVMNIGAH